MGLLDHDLVQRDLAAALLVPQDPAQRGLALFIISIFVNIGMWFERFVIVVTSLHRDFLPSSWAYFSPTLIDVLTFVGSFGLFLTFFLLFCRFLPMIAISEIKATMPVANPHMVTVTTVPRRARARSRRRRRRHERRNQALRRRRRVRVCDGDIYHAAQKTTR